MRPGVSQSPTRYTSSTSGLHASPKSWFSASPSVMATVLAGMNSSMSPSGVVCTALSTAGGFITDLKIGYWIGTTPKKQESWKFLGVFVSAATVAGVMIILNKTYGFGPGSPLEAPQANAMAAVIQPLMQGGTAPWVLYFCGAVLALVLTGIGIPALPFALGMFLPLQLNYTICIIRYRIIV
mgnify:CR=1 FL=1